MVAFIIIPLLAGFEFFQGIAADAYDYLTRALLPPAPSSEPIQPPYTPPFSGGQCPILYYVEIRYFNGGVGAGGVNLNEIVGPIQGTRYFSPTGAAPQWYLVHNGGATNRQLTGTAHEEARITLIQPMAGQPADNCGDVPSDEEGLPTGGSGLGDVSSPPDLEEDTEPVYEGSPLVAIPSFASVLAAALAAAKAASTALAAISAIADAVSAIGKLLDRLKEFLDGEEKPENRSISRYDFGSIEEDGFLRLYPSVNLLNVKAEMLDLQFLSIPTYYGKYFGDKSPNFYRFKELGYIAFVSPTFGVLSQVSLEFGRCSIPIPEDSIGFFFHLGLEGGIVANVSCFYSTPSIRE